MAGAHSVKRCAVVNTSPSPSFLHAWRGPLLVLLVAAVGAAGVLAYRLSRPAPPAPPDPGADTLEPAVVAAVRAARERVLKEPTSATAWGELGEVFFANDLEDEARACFVEAVRIDPDSARWVYLGAAVLVNRGDREGALPELRRAIELVGDRDADNPGPQFVLAETLLLLGRRDEAAPYIRRALERRPQDARGRFDAGLLAVAYEDWELARTHLLTCLDSPYTRQKSRIQLAAVCRRLGDPARADEFQTDADRVPPDASWPDPVIDACFRRVVKKRSAFRVAEALEAQGRFAEALERVLPLVERNPDDDVALGTVGRLHVQMGNFPAAEEALRKARRVAPQKVQSHYTLTLLLLEEGKNRKRLGDAARAEALFREAAGSAREALAIKPDYGLGHFLLGGALFELGQLAEARAAFEAAVRCSPEHAEIHLNLADVLHELGAAPEARARYEQALKLAPPGVPWRKRAEARLAELSKPKGK